MQEYKEAPCKVNNRTKVGEGGNGIVGLVPNFDKETVIKIFKVNKKSAKRNVIEDIGDFVKR